MVKLLQTVLSALSLSPLQHQAQHPPQFPSSTTKSIAIVGGGSAGLAALGAILDLPLEIRREWSIVLFEQREDVGGVWLPDPVSPRPPVLPATPLYPRLRTNTPHPTMTYPNFTFPPLTPLFPSHHYVLGYHQHYADVYGLRKHMHFNTTVIEASWKGNEGEGRWNVKTKPTRNLQDGVETHQFDHLIVASGHNHYPVVPHFLGEDLWLENTPNGSPNRSIIHSIFYREPSDYTNRTVIVVGGGGSGQDAALQIKPIAHRTYISLKVNSTVPPFPMNSTAGIIIKPRIANFTRDSVVFEDGTSVADADSLILATGYELRIPFLDAGRVLRTDPSATSHNATRGYTGLTTNLRYLFPLHEHIFSLSSAFPTAALAFVGLPVLIANCPSDRAQSLFIAHAIANSSLLPSRDKLLERLAEREVGLEERGLDPYYIGHRLVGDGAPEDYQDDIVQFLRESGAIPLRGGKKYVEKWRRDGRRDAALLRRAWGRIEEKGREEELKWLGQVETEMEWADLMQRMALWQRGYEEENAV